MWNMTARRRNNYNGHGYRLQTGGSRNSVRWNFKRLYIKKWRGEMKKKKNENFKLEHYKPRRVASVSSLRRHSDGLRVCRLKSLDSRPRRRRSQVVRGFLLGDCTCKTISSFHAYYFRPRRSIVTMPSSLRVTSLLQRNTHEELYRGCCHNSCVSVIRRSI